MHCPIIENSEVYICAITLAEVISKVAREERDVEATYNILLSNSQIINIDEELFCRQDCCTVR
jgi:predicted nucleic acid-binding protein